MRKLLFYFLSVYLCTIIIVKNCFFRSAGLDHNPDEKHSSPHDIQHWPSRTSGKSPAAEKIFLIQFLFLSYLKCSWHSFRLVFLGDFLVLLSPPHWKRIIIRRTSPNTINPDRCSSAKNPPPPPQCYWAKNRIRDLLRGSVPDPYP